MRGDHLHVPLFVAGIRFEHHGIDMGDGTVIHLAPVDGARITLRDTSDRFTVRRDPMELFSRGQKVTVCKHHDCLSPDEVAANAERMLGETGYHLLDGNCEHFAHYCCTGILESRQVEMGHSVVVAAASLATKAFWTISSRISMRGATSTAVKSAAKSNPLLLIADGVELATLAVGCATGLTAKNNRRIARATSTLTAAGIGAVVGGPVGAVASIAVHNGSTAIAEGLCNNLRRIFSRGQSNLAPTKTGSANTH